MPSAMERWLAVPPETCSSNFSWARRSARFHGNVEVGGLARLPATGNENCHASCLGFGEQLEPVTACPSPHYAIRNRGLAMEREVSACQGSILSVASELLCQHRKNELTGTLQLLNTRQSTLWPTWQSHVLIARPFASCSSKFEPVFLPNN